MLTFYKDIDTLSTNECNGVGPRLNEFDVSTSCIYNRDCTIFTPTRCETGDQTSKLGPLDVPVYRPFANGEAEVGKYYFIDSGLSLCGPNSIIGRSVVVNDQDFADKHLTCTNVFEFRKN